ncbi:M16 family metallopeptidase [Egbenema bharatensis]|uniref:M16 family metallopeptidase n=1 Tax=Egbenema bharatensis TaxID=3463334 RepID=UPI003A85BCAA
MQRLDRFTSNQISLNQISLDQIFSQIQWRWRRWVACWLVMLLFWAGFSPVALAQAEPRSEMNIQPYIDGVINRITDFTLDNGLRFIVMERHQAPVISFMTYVNVGAAEEEDGKTGIAHYLEHLAFKGTTRIGTTDYQAEAPLLDRLDELFEEIQTAEQAGQADKVVELQQEFLQIQAEAEQYVKQNEYGQIVDQSGGVGLNATTSADATRYFYSFPSNKLELWMSLESERFLDPVFRGFHEEREVILEERRTRTDNSPIGKMIEEFLGESLQGQPYSRPVIGYEADIRNITRPDIQAFFDTYYTPDNMIVAIVGDVDPNQVREFAEAYFGRYQARSPVPPLEVVPPERTEPREVIVEFPSQPWYMEGYQRPPITSLDNQIYNVISSILTSGRTSRLYRSLIDTQMALSVNISPTFPGNRFTNLMLVYALTAPNHTVDEVATVMQTEFDRLRTESIAPEELDRVKAQTRASLLQTLASNQGMASLLPEYEAKTGSWRNLFEDLKRLDAVTAEDVQRVAQELFQPQNLTVGKLLPAG